jgi:ketosteroid isomerase-like protein
MHNRWTLTAALAVSFVAAAGVATGAAPPVTPATMTAAPMAAKPAGPSDRAQIQALEKGFGAAFSAKNVNRIMSYYARQGLFVFDVTPPRQHVGWADYKKDWQDFLGAVPGPVTFKISDLAITVVGPVAYSHSMQDIRHATKGGGNAELNVRVTDVYRKLAGKWQIVQEHVSVPVDVVTGKADLMSKP